MALSRFRARDHSAYFCSVVRPVVARLLEQSGMGHKSTHTVLENEISIIASESCKPGPAALEQMRSRMEPLAGYSPTRLGSRQLGRGQVDPRNEPVVRLLTGMRGRVSAS